MQNRRSRSVQQGERPWHQRRIEANRANAQKSTGPRTEQGKARSRANPWKHGLTASMLVITGEEPEEFDELRAALIASYDPQSPWECELVERLVGIFWRLRSWKRKESDRTERRGTHQMKLRKRKTMKK